MIRLAIGAVTLALIYSSGVSAAPPEPSEEERLVVLLRGLLLANLPTPLVEAPRNWGHQREVLVGLKWHGPRPEPQKSFRNDGHWQRVRLEAVNPATTLALGVNKLVNLEPGKVTFDALIGLDTRLTYEQQVWKSGVRLYSGETRARCRAALRLSCEVTNRLEKRPGTLLPDVVFRVRVTEAEVFYTDLVCEHTLGMGGDAAKVIGQAVHDVLNAVKPSVERDLLAKANAAIVKAADTKDVRVEFDRLLSGKIPATKRPAK
jgi:hypothetical protein